MLFLDFLKPLKIWYHLDNFYFHYFKGGTLWKNLKTPEICHNNPYLWPRWSGPFTKFYNILQKFTIFLAQLAYELEVAKVQQKIRTEQIKIDVVVRKKQIEIEEEEMKRKEKELIGTVRLPAEAEAFK